MIMKFMHYEWSDIGPEDVIEITLSKQANVRLLDDANYHRYRRGASYNFKGGTQVETPAHLSPPHQGHWHLVVDLKGYAGSVAVDVRLI